MSLCPDYFLQIIIVKLLQRGVSMKNNGENGSSLCENYTRLKMDINLWHRSHQVVESV